MTKITCMKKNYWLKPEKTGCITYARNILRVHLSI